jgi:ElaA protein
MRHPTVRAAHFAELDATEAYALARLRQDVFVVEQASPYPDLDGRDLDATTVHLLMESDGVLIGCARVVAEGPARRIGRVALAGSARGRGLGNDLVDAALAACGDAEVRLDAQTPLAGWYAGFGFVVTGPEFDEDGVLHVPMARPGRA